MNLKFPYLSCFSTFGFLVLAVHDVAGKTAEPPEEIRIPGQRVFPESLTSAADGTVIIGSAGARTIFRVKPGADRAEPWIMPGTDGIHEIFGVFADDNSDTLYACSGQVEPAPPAGPPPVPASLYLFNLKTGQPKGRFPLPTSGAFCNDIAVGADGTAYVTDYYNNRILDLKRGAKNLEVWAGIGGEFRKAGLDGIAVLGDRVIVNAMVTSKLYSVRIGHDGKAGTIKEIQLDHEIMNPDGMRRFGEHGLLVAEGGNGNGKDWSIVNLQGRLSRIDLIGDTGKVTEIRSGLSLGGVSVTVVGKTAYVLEGQITPLVLPERFSPDATLYRVFTVPVGMP